MRIAVCIPTYNQSTFLEKAVHSAFAQDAVDVEVWLSDDASTDDTPLVASRLCRQYPQLRYTRQAKNLGIGGNVAWLLRQPNTELLARLDSDDYYESGFLSRLSHALLNHAQAAYAHCAVREVDAAGTVRRERWLARQEAYQDADAALKASTTGYRVAANILLFRRQALECVDFLRPDMTFAEDWDLAVRLADREWGNAYVADLLAGYRVWTDVDGYRAGRKLNEIEGIQRVFEESLEPAFRRRGWAVGGLTRRRKALAVNQLRAVREAPRNTGERNLVASALLTLGDSRRLRCGLFLIRARAGLLLEASHFIRLAIADSIKGLVRAWRTLGSTR